MLFSNRGQVVDKSLTSPHGLLTLSTGGMVNLYNPTVLIPISKDITYCVLN